MNIERADARGTDKTVEPQGPAVLVVEGSSAARHALAELLREYGHKVHAAGSVHELDGLRFHPGAPPQLAFLDFRTRSGRGDEAAALLRARWPELFVVYLSCLRPEDDPALRLALRAPSTALLMKPTSFDAILEIIRGGHRRAARHD